MQLSDLKIIFARRVKEIHDTTRIVKLELEGNDPRAAIARNES